MNSVPNLDQITEAAVNLSPHIVNTPVVRLQGRTTDAFIDGCASVHMKLELFQRTGTFKARGALLTAMSLPPERRKLGVTAASAGNHAIAVAYAASVVGASAKILVQASANPLRIAATRAYGAEVILAPDGAAAFSGAEALVRDEGRYMIHPFEGPLISLGTATVGLELMQQLPDTEAVVVAVGGGGLASGMATAIKLLRPRTLVFGVEPVGANAMEQSFAAGGVQRLATVQTIADSLAPPMTLPYSYGLCRRFVDKIVTVSDDEIRKAMALLFYDAKLAVEPAGAAALAATIGPLRSELRGLRVAVIVCGANVDRHSFFGNLSRGEDLLSGYR
jgi:threonine dehydratase